MHRFGLAVGAKTEFDHFSILVQHHTCPIHRHNEIVMIFLVRHNRHHKVSQSVPHFMSRKTVTTFLRLKVGGHFVKSIVKCYDSHYVGVLDNPLQHSKKVPSLKSCPDNSFTSYILSLSNIRQEFAVT